MTLDHIGMQQQQLEIPSIMLKTTHNGCDTVIALAKHGPPHPVIATGCPTFLHHQHTRRARDPALHHLQRLTSYHDLATMGSICHSFGCKERGATVLDSPVGGIEQDVLLRCHLRQGCKCINPLVSQHGAWWREPIPRICRPWMLDCCQKQCNAHMERNTGNVFTCDKTQLSVIILVYNGTRATSVCQFVLVM